MKPNILICGKTGAGKTTLLQTVTQPGTVPDEAIGHGAPTTYGVIEYETEIANFMDCEGMEPGQTIQEYVDFIMNALADRQCSALGNSNTSWGAESLAKILVDDRKQTFSMGQFIWSGTDYIGEPTPYHT